MKSSTRFSLFMRIFAALLLLATWTGSGRAQPKGPAAVKTVSVARLATGGYTTTTWTAAPTVMKISAYPTGGKGSGSEATCKLWTKQLQQDEEIVNSAPATDQQDAQEALTDKDVDNALDAGCFVVF